MQDTSRDRSSAPDHDVSDGTWMTYGDLANLRQIDRASAFKLALRHKWRRQKNNKGQVTVLVPSDQLPGQDRSQDAAHDLSRHTAAFETALAAIEAAHARELATLREQIAGAEQARIAMQAMVEQFAGQLRDADEVMKAERSRSVAEIAAMQHGLDAARVEAQEAVQAAQEAQDAVEALRRATEVRKARGRLRRAWDGWRGR
jgi:hypothetical protein